MRIKSKNRLVTFLTIFFIFSINIRAFAAPYNTWTQGPNGRLVGTQTAYEPAKMLTYDLKDPEDVFIEDGTDIMYIADTGNSRLLVVDGNNTKVIGEGIISSPSGIFVNKSGEIYVADYSKKKVFIFDKAGALLKEIGKPVEPIYGSKNDFAPKKVAVDNRNNLYVISEGSVNGVIQFNNEGKFVGYVGSNRSELSFKMILQRLVFTDKQKSQLFKITPPSPTSIAIDNQGLLHTVTSSIKSEGIKKLNITGINILPADIYASNKLIDIDVDTDGNIYTLEGDGFIDVYDSFGNLLFNFGGKDEKYERLGMFKDPVAIDVADDGTLYVVDKGKRVIYSFKATEFAQKVIKGVYYYKQGLYVQSQDIWKDILKMNSSFILSYKALANAYFKQQNYQVALKDYRLAEDKKGYSDAYWQIRNAWIQENMGYILEIIFGLFFLSFILKKLDRWFGILKRPRKFIDKIKNIKIISELRYGFRFIKHPIDAFYDIKHSGKASVLSASILYIWLLVLQIFNVYVTGFAFSTKNPVYFNLGSVISTTFAPVALWIISNYLVSTISEGEGRFKHIYICTIYSLVPYLIIALPMQLLSNVLTLNELFLYSFSMFVAKAWSVVLLVIMVKELHDYTLKETIRNILVTVFTMLLMVLVLFILTILCKYEVDFIKSVIQELRIRG